MRPSFAFAALSAAAVVTLVLVAGRVAAQDKPASDDPTRRDLSAYRLRVEDMIEIAVHKPASFEAQNTRQLLVPANGEVSFSPIGKISLLGKTTFEVEEIIAQRLKDENFLTQPNVGCIVVKYAPRTVSVIGAVRASVELPIHKDLRILELLSRIGGLEAKGADFSNVTIRRTAADGHPFWFGVDVDRVFLQNDENQNVVVKEGDIIKIAEFEAASPQSADFVYVLGKVNSRGRIPMVKGRMTGAGPAPFTLVKLIAICSDFAEFADRTRVRIIRQTETGKKIDKVDFDEIIDGTRPDYELKPDDVIYVPESFL